MQLDGHVMKTKTLQTWLVDGLIWQVCSRLLPGCTHNGRHTWNCCRVMWSRWHNEN